MLNFCVRGIALLMVFLTACSERNDLAPVEEVNWKVANGRAVRHVVIRGETLFAIAFRYDQDYRQLAYLNHLQNPYTLRVGEVLNLKLSAPSANRAPIAHHYPVQRPIHTYTPPVMVKFAPHNNGGWTWPAQGRVVVNFAPQQGKKGIDIAGKQGTKIVASSSGVVAYAGNGLKGYDNLIIIKHSDNYLTAYGNNLNNLVREGQKIKAGQIIAEMGMIDRKFWGVHFEIRKAGQPVNPLNYLQKG